MREEFQATNRLEVTMAPAANLPANQIARQTKHRNAHGQHSARLRIGFKHRYLVSDAHQIVRYGEARDARADHGHALEIAASRRQHLFIAARVVRREVAGFGAEFIGYEALECADRNSGID